MLRMVFSFVKLIVLSVVILVLGNLLHWDGKTLSDQVRLRMSHAEGSDLIDAVRTWATRITQDARRGFQKKGLDPASDTDEEILPSERQKLKALIRELNSSREKE